MDNRRLPCGALADATLGIRGEQSLWGTPATRARGECSARMRRAGYPRPVTSASQGRGPAILATSVWLGAWLRGDVGADDLIAALHRAAPDAPPVVQLDAGSEPLGELLRQLRVDRVDRAWLLLPRPGRIQGWPRDAPGAPEPAVLLTAGGATVGLLRLATTGWRLDPVAHAPVQALEADGLGTRAAARAFAATIADAATQLELLGLDRAPAGELPHGWSRALFPSPPGLDPAAADLLARIASVRDALDLARADDGAAVTSGETRARAEVLNSLAGQLEDLLNAVVAGTRTGAAATPPPSVPVRAR